MSFFKTAKSSVYDPDFYQRVLPQKSLPFSFKYAAGLSLILAFFAFLPLIPLLSSAPRALQGAAGLFPADLTLTVTNGVVSSDVKMPYSIAYDAAGGAIPAATPRTGHRNFAVVDTTAAMSLEHFKALDTTVWIGKTFLVSEGSGGKISIDPIPATMNGTFSKDTIDTFVGKAKPYLFPLLFIASLAVYLVEAGVAYALILISALLIGLLIYCVDHLAKVQKHTYKDAYRAALHAVTLSAVLVVLLGLSGASLPRFAFTLFAVLVYCINTILGKKGTPRAI